jgi:glycerophosphoryl diester phosphodiesterase
MVLKIGFRGAVANAPENTLLSFKKALDAGADVLYLDVRCAKGGHVVVFRDSFINNLRVSKTSVRRLQQFDVGNNKPMPTLREVFDFASTSVNYMIMIHDRGAVSAVMALINLYVKMYGWSAEQFILASTSMSILRAVRRKNKMVFTAYCALLPFQSFSLARRYEIDILVVHHQFLYEGFIRRAHNRGLGVFTAVVDSPKEIEWFKHCGVDGIISRYPDRV